MSLFMNHCNDFAPLLNINNSYSYSYSYSRVAGGHYRVIFS